MTHRHCSSNWFKFVIQTPVTEDVNYFYRFILLGSLIAMNGFLAGAEVALLSSRRPRLVAMAAEGVHGAKAALELLERPERLLSVVQLGVTLLSLVLGSVGEGTVHELLLKTFGGFVGPSGQAILDKSTYLAAFLIIAFPHVVLGEVVPKNVGIERAERLAVLAAPILLFLNRIAGPFVAVIEKASASISRLVGVKGAKAHAGGHSVDELKFIIASVRTDGHLQGFEEEAMQHLLELKDLTARQVMVPRNHFVSVPDDASLNYVLENLNEHQYSRLLVYEDRPEHIVGIVHLKDLVRVWLERRAAHDARKPVAPFRLRQVMRRPLEVPSTKNLSELIDEFRTHHAHLALVVDEFGTVTGLVTLEDVLEQVFGEIEDEHDAMRPKPVAGEALELDGSTSILDLETQYEIALPFDSGFETLAGFLLFRLGYLPKSGVFVEYDGRRFTVVEMHHNRISRVRIEKFTPPAADAIAGPSV